MHSKRFFKSLINTFPVFFIINLILACFDIYSLGEKAVHIKVGKTRKEKFSYGFWSFIQFVINITIIGFIFTIYFWSKNQPSMAERFSGLVQVPHAHENSVAKQY